MDIPDAPRRKTCAIQDGPNEIKQQTIKRPCSKEIRDTRLVLSTNRFEPDIRSTLAARRSINPTSEKSDRKCKKKKKKKIKKGKNVDAQMKHTEKRSGYSVRGVAIRLDTGYRSMYLLADRLQVDGSRRAVYGFALSASPPEGPRHSLCRSSRSDRIEASHETGWYVVHGN